MRKILLLAAIVLQVHICRAQCPFPDIDYTNYYEVFSDDFNYNPASFQSDPAFIDKWLIPPPGICAGNATSQIDPANITMPVSGRIRFTEKAVPGLPCGKTHKSGWLHTQDKYFVDFGIIEASMRFPPHQDGLDDTFSAFPTFWIPNYHADPTQPWLNDSAKRNEIDIMDNHDGITNATWTKFYTYTYHHDTTYQAADKTMLNTSNPCFPSSINLASGFHRFSCLWTPSRIIFYVDQHYVKHYDFDGNKGATQIARTVRQLHSLIVALQTHEHTVSNLEMDVEWVRYLALQCNPGDLVVDPSHTYNLTNYPYLPPDYVTNYSSDFNMMKYHTITINDASPASPIRAVNTQATFMEAAATTILPNFVADQSKPMWGASQTNMQDVTHNWIAIPIPMNGYLEIRPASCDQHPPAGPGWPNDGGHGNDGGEHGDYPNEKYADQSPGMPGFTRGTFGLYPNPNNGDFTITLPYKGDYEIRIVNMMGETVYKAHLDDLAERNMQLSNKLLPGNYFVHISGKQQKSVQKLTVTK